MLLTEYETTVVVRPDISGDAIEGTLDRVREAIKSGGGKLLAVNHWGRRRLAYDIKKQERGIFVHTQYLGPSDLVAEIERNLRISDNVLRYMTIKVAKDVNPEERQAADYVPPQYDANDVEEEVVHARPAHTGDDEDSYEDEGIDAESTDEREV